LVALIEKEVNQIDDQVYTTRKDHMKNFLWEIEAIRRRVLSLIRLLGAKSNVLKAFENHHYTTTSSDSEIKIYINDVQDHVVAMLGSLHQFEGLLSRSKYSYLAQIEVSSMTERFKVFRTLARMAVLSLILTLMTLFANMFGMNTSADYVIFNEGTILPWFMIALGEGVLATGLFFAAKRWGIWW
jgi:Mg2+ and Co2+ transporter CorA